MTAAADAGCLGAIGRQRFTMKRRPPRGRKIWIASKLVRGTRQNRPASHAGLAHVCSSHPLSMPATDALRADRRHGARALPNKHPTLLQYVSANPRERSNYYTRRTHPEGYPRVRRAGWFFPAAPRDRVSQALWRGCRKGASGNACATV